MGAPAGNANAVKPKVWTEAIKRALARAENDPGSQYRTLNSLAEKLLDKCAEGDLPSLKELGDRMEGKPITIVGGDSDAPIKLEISWAIPSAS